MPRPGSILTVNAGSSSLKLRLLDGADGVLGERELDDPADERGLREAVAALLDGRPAPACVAHRVVHGGTRFTGPALLDPAVAAELEALADLAPLHNPPAVRAIRALAELRPDLAAVACFDTAFHAEMPAAAATYALPSEWQRRWQPRRYGFHGLSHAHASRRAAELLGVAPAGLRVVTAHLGAGASLAAVAGGRSVDTTMGFTPLEGLVMATRAGSVDPGLLLWIQRHGGIGPEDMERSLERESGLLGLAGSADMREVVDAAERGDGGAALALDVYVHRLNRELGAMVAALGGVDAIVFTGGVGENSAPVRERACRAAAHLGLELDRDANEAGHLDSRISGPGSTVAVLLVRAREDLEMARQARSLLTSAREIDDA